MIQRTATYLCNERERKKNQTSHLYNYEFQTDITNLNLDKNLHNFVDVQRQLKCIISIIYSTPKIKYE